MEFRCSNRYTCFLWQMQGSTKYKFPHATATAKQMTMGYWHFEQHHDIDEPIRYTRSFLAMKNENMCRDKGLQQLQDCCSDWNWLKMENWLSVAGWMIAPCLSVSIKSQMKNGSEVNFYIFCWHQNKEEVFSSFCPQMGNQSLHFVFLCLLCTVASLSNGQHPDHARIN